jgi:uncharacterized protein YbjT (DUF2867 family)
MDTVLVTGGTGVLGAAVARRLVADGRRVRVLSRRAERPATVPQRAQWAVGDLISGSGLAAALDGVGAVVHCATDTRHWKNDIIGTRHLIAAARAAGSPHLLYVSIVGVDRVPFGYYQVKRRVERELEDCGLPWTVQRTTQFHDLLLALAQQLTRLPVAFAASGLVFQPVDAGEVADKVAQLAVGEAAGRVPDMGGPEVLSAAEVVEAVLRARGRRRPVVSVPLPGKLARAVRDGGLLAPGHAVGQRRFADFVAHAPLNDRRYGAAQRSA